MSEIRIYRGQIRFPVAMNHESSNRFLQVSIKFAVLCRDRGSIVQNVFNVALIKIFCMKIFMHVLCDMVRIDGGLPVAPQ